MDTCCTFRAAKLRSTYCAILLSINPFLPYKSKYFLRNPEASYFFRAGDQDKASDKITATSQSLGLLKIYVNYADCNSLCTVLSQCRLVD
jgi:hypothetical protein